MNQRIRFLRAHFIMLCVLAASLPWAASARANTVYMDVTDDKFVPRKVEVTYGDRIIFHNLSRIIHSVHITGHVYRFGQKHFVHDLLIYPDRAYVFDVNEDSLKPGSYNVGCSLHNRMRGQIVVHESARKPKALREGEHRNVKP